MFALSKSIEILRGSFSLKNHHSKLITHNSQLIIQKLLRGGIFALLLIGCNKTEKQFDATGTFEANEIVISAEATGRILNLDLTEGQTIEKGKILGKIDPLSIELQKEQLTASMSALEEKQNDAAPQIQVFEQQITVQRNQIAVQRQQLTNLQREQKRFAALEAENAIPRIKREELDGNVEVVQKQIAAAESSIAVLERQIAAQKAVVGIQNRGILSEKKPLEKRMKQLDDQMARTQIASPIGGTILSKYAEAGEITTVGKPIFKIGDLSEMTLRAYVTGDQLGQIKVGQTCKVLIDNGKEAYREMQGIVNWVSEKAEFTPKTIQTKDERANLVYALKIKVKNDGTLKIGMYGEVMFK